MSVPSSTEHPSIARFREAHARLGGTGEVVILPDSVHTAALAAEALGCEVGAIANSLLFDADGSPVLILTSGSHRVDTGATAERIGVPALRRATPEFVRQHTGQVIGGVSPIAHPTPVPTWLDTRLQRVRRGVGGRRPPRRGLLDDLRRARADDRRPDDRRGVRGRVMEIWLNPACSKCRTAVSTLDEAGISYTVRRYLDDAPSPAELAEVLDRLGLEPWDIARDKEAKEEGIDLPRTAGSRDAWLAALSAHPRAHPAPDHHRRRRHHGRGPRPRLAGRGGGRRVLNPS